jgi:hypothetical protein
LFIIDVWKPSRTPSQHLLTPPGETNADPEMTPRLAALITHVTELHRLGLTTTHYAEEFILHRWRLRDPHQVL